MKRIIIKLVDAGDDVIVQAKEIKSLTITKSPELAYLFTLVKEAYFKAVWDEHTGQLTIQNLVDDQGW